MSEDFGFLYLDLYAYAEAMVGRMSDAEVLSDIPKGIHDFELACVYELDSIAVIRFNHTDAIEHYEHFVTPRVRPSGRLTPIDGYRVGGAYIHDEAFLLSIECGNIPRFDISDNAIFLGAKLDGDILRFFFYSDGLMDKKLDSHGVVPVRGEFIKKPKGSALTEFLGI